MSADSFHHLVEREMCKMKCLYDFDDFVSCVSNKGEALIPDYSETLLFKNGQGKLTKKPLLESVQCIKFIKGETAFYWKPSQDDNEFLSGDFLKKKVPAKILKGVQFENTNHHVEYLEQKKDDTITKLCPLMPNTRVSFWENLLADNNR